MNKFNIKPNLPPTPKTFNRALSFSVTSQTNWQLIQ